MIEMKFKVTRNIWLCLFSLLVFSGCKEGLNVQSGDRLPSILKPDSERPTITVPGTSVHYSSSSDLEIKGICIDGGKVLLSGDSTQTVSCNNYEYTFQVNKPNDGSYNFSVAQQVNGSESKAESLLWIKKSSVSKPALINPSSDPYFSSETVLVLQGSCETGAELILVQGGAGQTICQNSQFSLNVSKFVDGDYIVEVMQRDQAGNENSTSFTWTKKALEVSPDNPQIIVTSTQVFSITGGAAPYSFTFLANNSGGSFDINTRTYTAGTTAGVVDQIEIEDSQGVTRNIDVQVIPDVPDHFEFPLVNGNNQNQVVGLNLVEPLVAKIADQYGNAVSFFPVVFQKTSGDVVLLDALEQTSDADGFISMNVLQGFSSTRSYVLVKPRNQSLPDVNATGDETLEFQILSQNTNLGEFDLSFAVGNNPEDIAVIDADEDGNQDILVLNKGDNSVSIFSGTGNGLMTALPKLLNVCTGPSSMVSARIDNDLHDDLLLSCSSSGEYAFLSGNGNGTFAASVKTAVTLGENLPVSVKTGDFNTDGHVDFAMSSAGTSVVAVRFGNNDGTFAAPSLLSTGSSPSKIDVGELDNLNGEDIVVLNAGENTFSVFLNDGLGGFASQVKYNTGNAPSDILALDFNGDNYKDIAVVNNVDNDVAVYLNNLDGTFSVFGISTPAGLSPISFYADDINGDTFLDLIVANIGDSTVSILHGANNGTFLPQAPLNTELNPIDLATGDFNSDGVIDVLSVSSGASKVQIIPGQSNGDLGFVTSVGNSPVRSISGDFDGDGLRDKGVINQGDNAITLLKGDGKGLFTFMGTLLTGGSPQEALAIDLNNDGALDVVVSNLGTNSIRTFMGVGDGSFGIPGNYLSAAQPIGITSGDFNSDGNIDIAVACSGANKVSVFPGVGDGTFSLRQDSDTGAQPVGIAAADFNSDGRIDLVVSQQSELNGSIGFLSANGDGTFQAPIHYAAEQGASSIITGYLNADSFLDVAVVNEITSTVSIFTGQIDGSLNDASNYFSGFNPVGMVKGDVNGDNREDLIIANGINQEVTVLRGSLTANYSNYFTINTFVNTTGVEVDDLNSDGALDISVLDGSNSFMKVYLGH